MWLCIMQHIPLFTLNANLPPITLPCLGSPPGTQSHVLELAGESSAWLMQPGKALRRVENEQWWLGYWFVFPHKKLSETSLPRLKQSIFLRQALCFKAQHQKGSTASCSFFFDCKAQQNYTYDQWNTFHCAPGCALDALQSPKERHTNTFSHLLRSPCINSTALLPLLQAIESM